MKMLMLTLPFMVRDLITPKVLHCMHIMVCTSMYCADLCMYHVRTRLS
jgi:flagellar biosynthesis protein FliP